MTAKMKKLNQRKQKILGAVVTDYLHSAEPVSSERLSKKYIHDVSSATIRNEMGDLEQEGFLKHPHTSAGRIPTDTGYRYFVDQLMKIRELTSHELDFIDSEYKKAGKNLEDLLHTTLKVAATLSHLLAVITTVRLPFKVLSSGLSNIMKQPEFSDSDHIKNMLSVIEQEDMMARIMAESAKSDSPTIRIGSEIKHKKIKDCSIVISKYDLMGESLGTISIIGPTRMTYSKVTSVVDAVSKTLREILSEKG